MQLFYPKSAGSSINRHRNLYVSNWRQLAILCGSVFFLILGNVYAIDGALNQVRIDYWANSSMEVSNYPISQGETIQIYPWESPCFKIRLYRTGGVNPWTFSVRSPSGSITQWITPPGISNITWTFGGNEQGVWTAQVDNSLPISWNVVYVGVSRIQTNPDGCSFIVDGVTYSSPRAFFWDSKSSHTISAITPQECGGKRYAFKGWSDGGAIAHTIITPERGDSTYIANFTAALPSWDFNGDGKPDILWRNAATGDNYIWYMDGVTVLEGGNLPTVADQNWKVVGVGDFNHDDKADILWRNAATGENYVWYLDGVTVPGGGNLPTVADQNWKVVGVADFNHDDKADILWRNAATGENYVWYMDGVTVLDGGSLPTVADQNWNVIGLADYNSDDNPDVLWRNTATGDNYVWYMDGVTVLGGGSMPTVADQNWKVVGIADFNNDGKPDVLWRNTGTGDNYVWYLDGVTVLGGGNLPTVADQNWTIVP